MADKYDNYDTLYGLIRKARGNDNVSEAMTRWEKGRKPVSLSRLDKETAPYLKRFMEISGHTLFRALSKNINFIWVMDENADILIAVEEIAAIKGKEVKNGYPVRRKLVELLGPEHKETKLGHPCLGLIRVRAAGELYFDKVEGKFHWILNCKSGRFHREPERRATHEQEVNIAKMLGNLIGVELQLDRNI